MTESKPYPLAGGCPCREIRYQLKTAPLFVHCCHCRWCQRETGASFALNAMIETDRLELLRGEPQSVHTPSESGRGQAIFRCPICHVAVWSHYGGAGPVISFVRVGTLDEPDRLPPDIHIYTESKQPWLELPGDIPTMPQYYDRSVYWPIKNLARWASISDKIDTYLSTRSQARS